MHLKSEDCIDYYCNQVGGAHPYYQGITYQRGYGFFGDLRRYITPIAIKAGKYLGKQLFRTGRDVINDVSEGHAFKDSAKTRIRETSKRMKNDFFEKLQSGRGIKRKRNAKRPQSSKKTKRRKCTAPKDIFS